MRKSLFNTGQVSRADMLDASARLSSAQNRLAEVQGEQERIANTIDDLSQEIAEYRVLRTDQFNTEKSEVARQLAIAEEQIINLQSRIEHLVVKWPIKGVIKGLAINSVNAVVGSGEILMELVPVGGELLVEAKLLPEDIGHVMEGLSFYVKVSNFEYQRFGSIPGKVQKLSASTYLDVDKLHTI